MLKISRRFALILLLCLIPLPAETRAVTIFQTIDLHARMLTLEDRRGGFAYLAAVIRRDRAGCKSCILFSAGDLAQGSPVSTIFLGLPVYKVANLFGIDAATLGNHDFDYGWQRAREFVKAA